MGTRRIEAKYASILRMSEMKTMELVGLYKAEECLWNTSHPDYRNKAERSFAAKRIADELRIPGFKPHHVLTKFKNLRNAYSQELKKIDRGVEEGTEYVPKVLWFKKMNSFIRPHLQSPRGGPSSRPREHTRQEPRSRSTEQNVTLQPKSSQQTVFFLDGSENWIQPAKTEETMYMGAPDQPAKIFTMEPEDTVQDLHNSRSLSPITKPKTSQIIAESLKDISSNIKTLLSSKDDCYDSFGKYVAGLLRNLPKRAAWEVQPKIVSIITAAGLEHCTINNSTEENSARVTSSDRTVGTSAPRIYRPRKEAPRISLMKIVESSKDDHDYAYIEIKSEPEDDIEMKIE